MGFRTFFVAAGAVVLAACTGALPKAQPSVLPDGVYEFSERADGVTTGFSGRLSIAADSVTLLDTSPACLEKRIPPASGGDRSQAFTCGEFSLQASHQTGHWTFTYTAARTVVDKAEKCTSYVVVNGQRQCNKTTLERNERVVPMTGKLRLNRIDAPPP